MQIHQLKKIKKKRKRIGRGGKRGTFSGRGIKGQKARAGTRKGQPVIREAIKRYPKLKGYRLKVLKSDTVVVNLDVINKSFKEGEVVSPESLLKRRIIRRIKGRTPKVKVLGEGKLDKALKFRNCKFSSPAEKIIKDKGGEIS